MQRALVLMRSYVLWDGHNDLPWMYRKAANNQVDEPSLFDLRQNLVFVCIRVFSSSLSLSQYIVAKNASMLE